MKLISRLSLAAFAVVFAVSLRAADLSDQLGIQTWTLRNMKFEQVVEFAKKHGIRNLQMIGNHMDPKASPEETKRKKAVLDAAGLSRPLKNPCFSRAALAVLFFRPRWGA